MEATFFATPEEFRKWLEKHHQDRAELLVGFYKRGSGNPSMTWPESVDQALCFGWIDGVRRNIDAVSYSIRFTPRKERSNWSIVNIRKAEALTAEGLMRPAGLAAFATRAGERSGVYSFEQKSIEFNALHERRFRANPAAWKFFQAQAPWYRRAATWWVISAKREETQEKRLSILIEHSGRGCAIPPLNRGPKP